MTWNEQYEPVIGLEVHCQLLTKSKAFCSCSTKFGNEPNSNVCPVCLGMPGVLPVLNKQVVEFTIKMGLATHCSVSPQSILARKNYFYPDLPKGYQISQYEEPICTKGFVEIEFEDGKKKTIGITRIHLEEDAGKSIHDLDVDTLVDVNRCGVPLIEIVSEPELRSPHEAYLYLYKIRQIVTYLGICDGNMEEGSVRCDANVSVRKKGETKFGTKTEVKNMNSFRFVEKAIEYEINRQIELLEESQRVEQTAMTAAISASWDARQGITVAMRTKEEAHDYRYFPEPDLVPVTVNNEWIESVRKQLPELPNERRDRFVNVYKIPKYDANILTSEKPLADSFDSVISELTTKNETTYKLASNWLIVNSLTAVNAGLISLPKLPDFSFAVSGIVNSIVEGKISSNQAKEVFEEAIETMQRPEVIIAKKGLLQITDVSQIERVVQNVLSINKEQVEKYRAGKSQVFGFFVGEVMKAMKGKGNPKLINEILKKKLEA